MHLLHTTMSRVVALMILGVTVALTLAQLSTLTILPVHDKYDEAEQVLRTNRGLDRAQRSSIESTRDNQLVDSPRKDNGMSRVEFLPFIRYCNSYGDLREAFCGGRTSTCSTRRQARKCKRHWTSTGIREGREGPIIVDSKKKAAQLAELDRLKLASTKSPSTAAICAIAKNEEAYLDEFVDYHHALGFDTFYIYDNSVDFELQQWGSQKGPHVQVIHFPGENAPQGPAYLACGKQAYQDGHTWAAFFDIDEFLVLKQHQNVVAFLEEYGKTGAISVNWILMGTGEQLVYSPQPMTKRFKYRVSEDPDQHLKTIVRLEHMDMTRDPFPHYPYLVEGHSRMTTDGLEIYGPYQISGPTDVAVLYHYGYKSYKEYIKKRERGRADVPSDSPIIQEQIQASRAREVPNATIYDDTVWKAMKKYVPRYKAYEELFPFP